MDSQKVNKGLWCPDCDCATELINSIVIYRVKSYGMCYRCPQCLSYVGCHKGTTDALGRVANKELRKAKHLAHKEFDKIWKSNQCTRREAYSWLGQTLGLSPEQTHIGMFTLKQCADTVFYSSQLIQDLKQLGKDFGKY
jgi:hypothetical protein